MIFSLGIQCSYTDDSASIAFQPSRLCSPPRRREYNLVRPGTLFPLLKCIGETLSQCSYKIKLIISTSKPNPKRTWWYLKVKYRLLPYKIFTGWWRGMCVCLKPAFLIFKQKPNCTYNPKKMMCLQVDIPVNLKIWDSILASQIMLYNLSNTWSSPTFKR